MELEWDAAKREADLVKHGFDFLQAKRVFDGPIYTAPSPRGEEQRFVTIGRLGDRFVAVVWAPRDGKVRIISVRRARATEARKHHELHG